jgi:hypothetical protein
MIIWSNHDRAAFNEWLNADLGQKALRYLEQSRPKFDDSMDINALAIQGAMQKGYELALNEIDKMRSIVTAGIPKASYIPTHED